MELNSSLGHWGRNRGCWINCRSLRGCFRSKPLLLLFQIGFGSKVSASNFEPTHWKELVSPFHDEILPAIMCRLDFRSIIASRINTLSFPCYSYQITRISSSHSSSLCLWPWNWEPDNPCLFLRYIGIYQYGCRQNLTQAPCFVQKCFLFLLDFRCRCNFHELSSKISKCGLSRRFLLSDLSVSLLIPII